MTVTLEKHEIMEKAVSVGILMSDYHILFGQKEPFKGHALIHAYKFALIGYHSEKPRKEALKYAASIRREHHTEQQLRIIHEAHHHYQETTRDQHMENMDRHLNAQHLHQLHQEHMNQVHVHQQRQMDLSHDLSR